MRMQVPDVCLLPAHFSTELREVGFVWMQTKKVPGDALSGILRQYGVPSPFIKPASQRHQLDYIS